MRHGIPVHGADDKVRSERRATARLRATLSVCLHGHPAGETRDVSPAGVYALLDGHASIAVDDRLCIHIVLDRSQPSNPIDLIATAVVLRVEPAGTRLGVAARVEQWVLSPRPRGARH